MWAFGIHLYKVKLPWLQLAKIASISAAASLTAHFIAMRMAPIWDFCGGSAALVILFALYYAFRVIEPQDSLRLKTLSAMLPWPFGIPAAAALAVLARPQAAIGPSPVD